jgi:hypothetical protein
MPLTYLFSSVGIAMGCTIRLPAGVRELSVFHSVQTDSGAHAASYPMGTRDSFPDGKEVRREGDHSPPSSAEV